MTIIPHSRHWTLHREGGSALSANGITQSVRFLANSQLLFLSFLFSFFANMDKPMLQFSWKGKGAQTARLKDTDGRITLSDFLLQAAEAERPCCRRQTRRPATAWPRESETNLHVCSPTTGGATRPGQGRKGFLCRWY